MHAANMLLEVKNWIAEHHPFWKRNPANHLWLVTHDEGSCWVPKVQYPCRLELKRHRHAFR